MAYVPPWQMMSTRQAEWTPGTHTYTPQNPTHLDTIGWWQARIRRENKKEIKEKNNHYFYIGIKTPQQASLQYLIGVQASKHKQWGAAIQALSHLFLSKLFPQTPQSWPAPWMDRENKRKPDPSVWGRLFSVNHHTIQRLPGLLVRGRIQWGCTYIWQRNIGEYVFVWACVCVCEKWLHCGCWVCVCLHSKDTYALCKPMQLRLFFCVSSECLCTPMCASIWMCGLGALGNMPL